MGFERAGSQASRLSAIYFTELPQLLTGETGVGVAKHYQATLELETET